MSEPVDDLDAVRQISAALGAFEARGGLEAVEDFDKNTYRAVYKVQLGDVVYVLHVFQKKSKSGKATPKVDIDLIKSRLKLAKQDHERRTKAKGKS